jgi:hypothetical protein
MNPLRIRGCEPLRSMSHLLGFTFHLVYGVQATGLRPVLAPDRVAFRVPFALLPLTRFWGYIS